MIHRRVSMPSTPYWLTPAMPARRLTGWPGAGLRWRPCSSRIITTTTPTASAPLSSVIRRPYTARMTSASRRSNTGWATGTACGLTRWTLILRCLACRATQPATLPTMVTGWCCAATPCFPPAAGGKQGVAAQHQPVTIVGNVAGCVARHAKHLKINVQRVNPHAVPVAHPVFDLRDALVIRAVYGRRMTLDNGADAVGVVVVMMRDEHGRQRKPAPGQPVKRRAGLAGVNQYGVAGIVQRPYIVGFKGGNGGD